MLSLKKGYVLNKIIPAVLLLFWQFTTNGGIVSNKILPQPMKVGDIFIQLMSNGELMIYRD